MTCPVCSEIVSDDYRYCLHCGADLGAPTVVRSSRPPPPPRPRIAVPFEQSAEIDTPRERDHTYWLAALVIVLGFLFLAAIAAIGGLYYFNQPSESKALGVPSSSPGTGVTRPSPAVAYAPTPPLRIEPTPDYQPSPYQSPSPAPSPQIHLLIDDAVAVGARKFASVPFELPARVRVGGTFRASGGGNDIQVYVLDRDGFTRLTNGDVAKTYYNSNGYVSEGKVDLMLGPGAYWLVCDNRKALLTNKVVAVRLGALY